jgi:hypothetical protein
LQGLRQTVARLVTVGEPWTLEAVHSQCGEALSPSRPGVLKFDPCIPSQGMQADLSMNEIVFSTFLAFVLSIFV